MGVPGIPFCRLTLDRSSQDERRLVVRCLAGDQDAWRQFIRNYSPFLAAVVRQRFERFRVPPSPDRVEEVLQETFVVLLRDRAAVLRRYRWEAPLETYLVRMAASRVVDWIGRNEPVRPRNADPDRSAAPEASWPLERREAEEQVHRALEKLGDRERLAVKLFYWRGFSAEQVAELLRIQRDHVWTILSRARKQLERILSGPSVFL